MPKLVYDFAEGGRDMKDLLGGKGANLAEMTVLGLPVPPGYTITTEACRTYLESGSVPPELAAEVDEHLEALQERMGKRLGDADGPAARQRPVRREVLHARHDGHGPEHRPERRAASSGWPSSPAASASRGTPTAGCCRCSARPCWASRASRTSSTGRRRTRASRPTSSSTRATCARSSTRSRPSCRTHTGEAFPQDPRTQLDLAVNAVFDSWNTERARIYRRQERIPADLGTAVNVCSMVFGNLGADSGTGVAFTRDPGSGAQGVYGDYLQDAQGEDVVAGIRNTLPLADLQGIDEAAYDELLQTMQTLEEHYRDLCDIEFTIERGKLWMLQTRVGKRTAGAAFRIATQLVDEGMISEDEALDRVSGAGLARLMFPAFGATDDATEGQTLLGKGMGASPGAAVGKVVFDSGTAVAWAARGEDVVLVRRETTPDDLAGMIAAQGILTSRGGKTSHAAVVARGMGKTCVCGAEDLEVDLEGRTITSPDGTVVAEGDVLSIDGTSGKVFLGAVPVRPSPVVEYFEGELAPEDGDDLVQAVHRLVTHADEARRLDVRANADTPDDAARARRFGAQGIGLCRTEHMFLGERRQLVEDLVLARGEDDQQEALAALLPLQREDFTGILRAMDGLPVTVRLIDPPLHEFLPDLTELSVEVAVAEATGQPVDQKRCDLLDAVRRLHESNPMIGLRGVRLGLVIPGLFAMQVRALAEAARDLRDEGLDPRPEIMVPLVATVQELEHVREEAVAILAEVGVDALVGTMIEIPRAALTAGEIAGAADFFSFGTNDLTQMGWGFSRDDVEASFFSRYLDLGIFGVSPFESIDTGGVGRLVRIAVDEGRATKPELKVGVCGEHGGDPDSVHFFHEPGSTTSPARRSGCPVARLEAGRAAVRGREA